MNIPTIPLSNGMKMPALGLGTYGLPAGAPGRQAIQEGLALGYRHLDSAAVYKNEHDVGQAIRESGLPREEIFVVTKVWNDHQYGNVVPEAFGSSLERLGLSWVDLYLIHHPIDPLIIRSWKNLESFHDEGRARSIGVSNFNVAQLEILLAGARIKPVVNQIHFNLLHPQRELREFCRKQDIALVAHSPFEQGKLLADERVVSMARDLGRTPAQLLLRWIWQSGVVPIPKSSNPVRMKEHLAIFEFELSTEVMSALDRFAGAS